MHADVPLMDADVPIRYPSLLISSGPVPLVIHPKLRNLLQLAPRGRELTIIS